MKVQARLEPAAFSPERELAEFVASLDAEGAVVSFIGLARPCSAGGAPIDRLFLDHHPRLTERSLVEIGTAAVKRFEIGAVRIVHRCGDVLPKAPIVFAAAAAGHRRAAFDAADYLMDRLKTDALFWKREDAGDASAWIEPTNADHEDRERWEARCRE